MVRAESAAWSRVDWDEFREECPNEGCNTKKWKSDPVCHRCSHKNIVRLGKDREMQKRRRRFLEDSRALERSLVFVSRSYL